MYASCAVFWCSVSSSVAHCSQHVPVAAHCFLLGLLLPALSTTYGVVKLHPAHPQATGRDNCIPLHKLPTGKNASRFRSAGRPQHQATRPYVSADLCLKSSAESLFKTSTHLEVRCPDGFILQMSTHLKARCLGGKLSVLF